MHSCFVLWEVERFYVSHFPLPCVTWSTNCHNNVINMKKNDGLCVTVCVFLHVQQIWPRLPAGQLTLWWIQSWAQTPRRLLHFQCRRKQDHGLSSSTSLKRRGTQNTVRHGLVYYNIYHRYKTETSFTCDQVTLTECPVPHAVEVEVVHSLTEILLCELRLSVDSMRFLWL